MLPDELYTESRVSVGVRPNDLDALGHVNNAVVLETGRRDWLDRRRLRSTGAVLGVVARLEIDYRAEILTSSPA